MARMIDLLLVVTPLIMFVSCARTIQKVERFKVPLEEKGTRFSEEIDVDTKNNVEIFRVPAHNNFSGAQFYQYFKKGLTITKIALQGCYVSKMPPSLPPPAKMKANLEQVAFNPGRLPVETVLGLVKVTGQADKRHLPKGILKFCKNLTIYNTEVIHFKGDETSRFQVRRQKRQIIQQFVPCDNNALYKVLKDCPSAAWNVNCKMRTGTCYYIITCENQRPRHDSWDCKNRHITNRMPSCCDYACP